MLLFFANNKSIVLYLLGISENLQKIWNHQIFQEFYLNGWYNFLVT